MITFLDYILKQWKVMITFLDYILKHGLKDGQVPPGIFNSSTPDDLPETPSGPAHIDGGSLHGSSPLLAASALACWLWDAKKFFQGLKIVESATAGERRFLQQNLFLQNELGVATILSPVTFTQGGSSLVCVSSPR